MNYTEPADLAGPDDPDNAHDGSLGVLKMSTGSAASSGVKKTWGQSASAGQVYAASAWVRSDPGTTASVTLQATASGGSASGFSISE